MDGTMMNPRTHPRGAPPDFTLPRPNPNPGLMTDALWWFVCMCELLEPTSQNGGTYADKPGSHNIGKNLPDHGAGDPRTDHSIRHPRNRTGPWWWTKTAGRDWTFPDAQAGNYATINKYTRRILTAMRDPDDTRTDLALFYVLGQIDGDTVVEGYDELHNEDETSGDKSHNWHIHESWMRDIIGIFAEMWKVLTVYMGWTFADWRKSVEEDDVTPEEIRKNCETAVRSFMFDGYNATAQNAAYQNATEAEKRAMRTARDTLQGIVVAPILLAIAAAEADDDKAEAILGAIGQLGIAISNVDEEIAARWGDPAVPDETVATSLRDLLGAERAARIAALLAG